MTNPTTAATGGIGDRLSWAEVVEASTTDFLAIEAKRAALAERERLGGVADWCACASCATADGLSVPLRAWDGSLRDADGLGPPGGI